MQALMHEGGLTKYLIGKRLMTFGVDGFSIYQGTKSGVTKQIVDGWAPHSMGVHYMAHRTNLMVQTLSHLQMGNEIEGLLQTLYNYFSKSLKRHLEFSKLNKAYGNKGGQDFEECENPLDIYVVPCPMCYGKIQNIVDEDDL